MSASRSLSEAGLGVPTGAWRWASLAFVLLALVAAALTLAAPQVAGLAGYALLLGIAVVAVLFVFAVWIFFALNAIAMLRLRMKQPNLNRPYRALGYPVTAIIFLVAAIALTVNLWLVRPVRSTLGLLVIAAGIPLFYRWRKTSRPLIS